MFLLAVLIYGEAFRQIKAITFALYLGRSGYFSALMAYVTTGTNALQQ